MTHIYVVNLTNIDSDNGLSPGWRQAIIWTNAGLLLIGPLGTNFDEILIEILTFSFKKMRLKVSSAKRQPFCLGLNELSHQYYLPQFSHMFGLLLKPIPHPYCILCCCWGLTHKQIMHVWWWGLQEVFNRSWAVPDTLEEGRLWVVRVEQYRCTVVDGWSRVGQGTSQSGHSEGSSGSARNK